MPIYEYQCEKCGKVTDVLQKVNDPAPEKCEACGADGPLSRQVSRTSFVLKGGGWYSDLYSSSKPAASSEGSTAASTSSSSTSSSSGSSSSESSTTSKAAAPTK